MRFSSSSTASTSGSCGSWALSSRKRRKIALNTLCRFLYCTLRSNRIWPLRTFMASVRRAGTYLILHGAGAPGQALPACGAEVALSGVGGPAAQAPPGDGARHRRGGGAVGNAPGLRVGQRHNDPANEDHEPEGNQDRRDRECGGRHGVLDGTDDPDLPRLQEPVTDDDLDHGILGGACEDEHAVRDGLD